jgi:hypothetical protein
MSIPKKLLMRGRPISSCDLGNGEHVGHRKISGRGAGRLYRIKPGAADNRLTRMPRYLESDGFVAGGIGNSEGK